MSQLQPGAEVFITSEDIVKTYEALLYLHTELHKLSYNDALAFIPSSRLAQQRVGGAEWYVKPEPKLYECVGLCSAIDLELYGRGVSRAARNLLEDMHIHIWKAHGYIAKYSFMISSMLKWTEKRSEALDTLLAHYFEADGKWSRMFQHYLYSSDLYGS